MLMADPPLFGAVGGERQDSKEAAGRELQPGGEREFAAALRRQQVDESGDQIGGRRRPGDGQADGVDGGGDQRGHPLRAGVGGQPGEQVLIDRCGPAGKVERIELPRDRVVGLQDAGGAGRPDHGEGVVAEPRERVRRNDQALGIDAISAAAAVLEAGGRGPRDAIRAAGQRVEVDAGGVGFEVEQGIVRRSPDGQFPRVGLGYTGALGHELVAERPVGLGGSENGLFDVCHN